jgi:cell division protein FtsN
MRTLALVGTMGLLSVLMAGSLAAQSPQLQRVEELARMGRAEEARVELLEWWNGARDDSSQRDLQLGLWLRGRLTVDPAQAELDFQRLVVLYPSSPYTPQAIFRLAQARHAQGDLEGARRHVATLIRDYPSSQSRSEAEAWLQGAGAAPTSTTTASAPTPAPQSAPTGTGTGAPPATGNPAAAPPAAAAADTTPPFRPPRAEAAPEIWFVQFGAFADEGRAFALHEELVDAGLAARLVRVQGSAFLHVRIGRFTTREDANRQLEQVAARGYSASIVRDERPETLVNR